MDVLESEGYCFLFLTLTLRNCPWDELPAAIEDFLSGWRFMYHKAPIFRRAVYGTSRALEITVNHGARTYHPHLHVVLAVKPSYFTSRDYISQAQWTQLWRSCCDISYDPIVNIKRIKETSQGFKEISK
jgi:plasmid rolling circle replication initiator protein Rep